jgi:transcriptional regulator with XRE-family HTH domain
MTPTTEQQYTAFGDALRHHRMMVGLTQEELAERSGVSVRAIGDLERGVKHLPRRSTVTLLADALELSLDDRARFEATARRTGPPRRPDPESVSPGRPRSRTLLRALPGPVVVALALGIILFVYPPIGAGSSSSARFDRVLLNVSITLIDGTTASWLVRTNDPGSALSEQCTLYVPHAMTQMSSTGGFCSPVVYVGGPGDYQACVTETEGALTVLSTLTVPHHAPVIREARLDRQHREQCLRVALGR